MSKDFIFVSESVTEGHPDKLCDQISDAIVDHYLRQDPAAYIRAECAVSNSILFIAARFASTASVDLSHLARQVIAGVGYTTGEFNARSCSVLSTIQEVESGLRQEIDEAALSDKDIERLTAQQQVTVFGFACDQSPTLMPLPIHLAHKLCRHLTRLRTEHVLPCLMPEGRAQVGVEYKNRRPRRIHSVAVVTSHDDEFAVDPEARKRCQDVSREMIQEAFADEELRPDAKTEIIINPGGPLLFGGPSVHPGLTGRKNGVDTYGGFARHSEKALSGKDPMRIDRTGAYAARYAAKNVVAAGLGRGVRGPAVLLQGPGPAGQPGRGNVRHGKDRRRGHRRPRQETLRLPARGHPSGLRLAPPTPRPPQGLLPAPGRLRPPWPRRPRPALGTHGQGRDAGVGTRLSIP